MGNGYWLLTPFFDNHYQFSTLNFRGRQTSHPPSQITILAWPGSLLRPGKPRAAGVSVILSGCALDSAIGFLASRHPEQNKAQANPGQDRKNDGQTNQANAMREGFLEHTGAD